MILTGHFNTGTKMRQHANSISIALRNPDNWTTNEYCLVYHPTGASLWTSNGRKYLKIHPNILSLNWKEKRILWPQVERVLETLAAAKFKV